MSLDSWGIDASQCLWRGRDRTDQERVLLTPRAYALLRYLVEHPGRLLTHDELLDALWPNTHVQPEVLKSHIFEVPTALGDDSKKPLFTTGTRRVILCSWWRC